MIKCDVISALCCEKKIATKVNSLQTNSSALCEEIWLTIIATDIGCAMSIYCESLWCHQAGTHVSEIQTDHAIVLGCVLEVP